jgi:ankyrin repeat protein/Tfp pilus assembly protein PilF
MMYIGKRIKASLLFVFCGTLALASAQVAAQGASAGPGPDPEKLFTWADDILDDIGSASGARRIGLVLSALEQGITANPNSALLQLAMGRALIVKDCALQGNNCSVRAKGHLTKAIQLDPKLVRAHALLAHDAMNAGCLPCTKPHLNAAIRIEPLNPFVLEAKGRFLELSEQRDEAEKLYLQAIEGFSNPKKRWQSYNWLSNIYRQRDDYDKAEAALQRALEARPDGAWSQGNLGAFYIFTRGDYDKAIPLLRSAIAIMDYGRARQALALALYERWGAAYLKKAEQKILDGLLDEAVKEYPDKAAMVVISAGNVGTGRAARALLESKSVPNSVLDERGERGRTPLLMAANNANTDLALYLLRRGADPNARDDAGMSAVHFAALRGDVKLLRALADRKANFQQITESRHSALTIAVATKTRDNRLKAAQIAIDAGAPVDFQSGNGLTALAIAANSLDSEMIRYLLSRGASADIPSGEGLTPPAWAILRNDRESLEIFIEKKAGLDAKVHGRSLIQIAEGNGRRDLADMLRKAVP